MKLSTPIDLWDVSTYDEHLRRMLDAHTELIRQYFETDRRLDLKREAADRWMPVRPNPYAQAFVRFTEGIVMPAIAERTIRGWHYTRLTDDEVEIIRKKGIYPSTLATLRARLDAQVIKATLTRPVADALYQASPFHKELMGNRSNKFWMVSQPRPVDDSGVTLLLESWGGESVYFWLEDAALQRLVAQLGKPRVLEIAVPMRATQHSYSAARAAVAAVARTLGLKPDSGSFDLYSSEALGPEAILRIHTAGEEAFERVGRGKEA